MSEVSVQSVLERHPCESFDSDNSSLKTEVNMAKISMAKSLDDLMPKLYLHSYKNGYADLRKLRGMFGL